jgi:hypothetical protein
MRAIALFLSNRALKKKDTSRAGDRARRDAGIPGNMMKASDLVQTIKTQVEANFPGSYIVTLDDRSTPGLPGLEILYRGFALFVETIIGDKPLSKIQKETHRQIQRAGGLICVADSWEDVESVLCGIRSVVR